MSKTIGILSGIVALSLAFGSSFLPGPGPDDDTDPPTPVVNDVVHDSFVLYEKLWRKHSADAAKKLESGELKTDKATWEFLAAGQEPARRIAFDELASKEQAYFKEAGEWSPEVHAKILRSYSSD
jgi:hypothetical protein